MAEAKPDPREAKFLALWSTLDLDEVKLQIRGREKPLYDFDEEEAREAVLKACERWLIDDLEQMELRSVETEYKVKDFKFVIDLGGTFTGRGTKIVQYDDKTYSPRNLTLWRGLTFVADWKTTKRDLDARWQDSLTDSRQWRDYLAHTGAEIFVYRGIQRKGKIGEEIQLREFAIHRGLQPDLIELHKANLDGIIAQRDALIDLNIAPWPQNMPSACGRYGGCRYKDDCLAGLKYIPAGNLTKGREMSYSRMEEFKACAELHRRSVLDRIANSEEESGPDAEFGLSFHRGICEAYKQAFGLKG